MGEIAEDFCDQLIITDDNPRNEEGDEIVEHILSGIDKPDKVCVIRDRAAAISHAVSNANAGDVVLAVSYTHLTLPTKA